MKPNDSSSVMVVVSHHNARQTAGLIELLDGLNEYPAGLSYRVRVIVNHSGPHPTILSSQHKFVEIWPRQNTGYNIGAWEWGWRRDPKVEGYLFLQDECRVQRKDWLAAFHQKAQQLGVGLVGECINPRWNKAWTVLERRYGSMRAEGHRLNGKYVDRMSCYRNFFEQNGIDRGEKGDHLQTVALYARREVLEAMDGFPIRESKGEAIAAEIGISKKVQSLGLQIAEVGPKPYWYFTHPNWSDS